MEGCEEQQTRIYVDILSLLFYFIWKYVIFLCLCFLKQVKPENGRQILRECLTVITFPSIYFFSINYSCCKNRSAEGNSCLLRVRNVIFFVAKEEKQGKINSKTFDLFRFKVTYRFDWCEFCVIRSFGGVSFCWINFSGLCLGGFTTLVA